MGRKKVELKRIEDKNSRQVTFSKRRNGLIKKARELSVLCDVDVALLVFSSRGKLYHFSSPNNLDSLLKRYRRRLEEDDNTNTSNAETTDLMPYSNMLEIIHRCLGDLDDVAVSELVQLEKKLDTALAQTRSRKTEVMMESVVSLRNREKRLEAERDELQRQIEAMEENNNNDNIMENNSDETNTSSKRARLSLLHL